jgi:hypothetical protein
MPSVNISCTQSTSTYVGIKYKVCHQTCFIGQPSQSHIMHCRLQASLRTHDSMLVEKTRGPEWGVRSYSSTMQMFG